MQDRFKFRVPFFNNDDKFIGYDYCEMINGINVYNAGTCYKGDIQLSTGLKDKNGKLIYEGDIIEVYSLNVVLEVRFDKGKFIGFDHKIGTGITLDLLSNKKIIGNIYENKELLEEK